MKTFKKGLTLLVFLAAACGGSSSDSVTDTSNPGWVDVGEPFWVSGADCLMELVQRKKFEDYDGINEIKDFVIESYRADEDYDGVCDDYDFCSGTGNEGYPLLGLAQDHYFYQGYNGWVTNCGGAIIGAGITIDDTFGCNCEQILEYFPQRRDEGMKYGCDYPTLDEWVNDSHQGWYLEWYCGDKYFVYGD